MTKKKTPDPDKPLTEAEWASLGPAMHGIDALPAEAKAAVRKLTGRPRSANPKRTMTIRIAPDLVAAIKASGRGYNTRVEALLREAVDDGRF
jgi:uncharacterized protein (DUF4415 family)